MNIAYVSSKVPGEIDRIMNTVAQSLQAQKKRLAGIVKVMDYSPSYDDSCDMKVNVLPSGPQIQVTQNLGAGSNACRLSPAGIAEAVFAVEAQSVQDADLFILNKFGPEESAGRGFCNVIGAALEHQVPVLVGVGEGSLPAFKIFTDGLAEQLPADEATVLEWAQRVTAG